MKIGRNDPCPCGSGKKYKHCCLNKNMWDEAFEQMTGKPASQSREDNAHELMMAAQRKHEAEQEAALVKMSATPYGALKAERIRTCRARFKEATGHFTDDLNATVQAAIDRKHGDISMDEINAVVNKFQEKENNLRREDMFGLSTSMTSSWIRGAFNDYEGLEIVTPEDVSQSPVMRYLDLMFKEALENKGRIKLTVAGNLNMKFIAKCRDIREELAVAEYYKGLTWDFHFHGKKEDEFTGLAYTRMLSQICGLFYVRTGYLNAKKDALAKYEKEGVRGFFYEMLRTACVGANWAAYYDEPVMEPIRTTWLFLLWRMSKRSSCSEVREDLMTALPGAAAEIYSKVRATEYSSADQSFDCALEVLIFVHLMQYWGFARRVPGSRILSHKHEVMPLFARTFKFEV